MESAKPNHPRHRAFAYEQLIRGRGYWWIVHELAKTDSVTEDEAHAIVTGVWPQAMKVSLQRNRRLVWFGAALCSIPLLLVGWGVFVTVEGDAPVGILAIVRLAMNPISLGAAVVGLSSLVYGWSGLRRYARTGMNPGASEPPTRGL